MQVVRTPQSATCSKDSVRNFQSRSQLAVFPLKAGHEKEDQLRSGKKDSARPKCQKFLLIFIFRDHQTSFNSNDFLYLCPSMFQSTLFDLQKHFV